MQLVALWNCSPSKKYTHILHYMVGEKRRGNGVMEIIMSHCHFNSRKGGNRGLIHSIYDSKRQCLCAWVESLTQILYRVSLVTCKRVQLTISQHSNVLIATSGSLSYKTRAQYWSSSWPPLFLQDSTSLHCTASPPSSCCTGCILQLHTILLTHMLLEPNCLDRMCKEGENTGHHIVSLEDLFPFKASGLY